MGFRSALLILAVLLPCGSALPQDAKDSVSLAWNLPHDRAAVYEVFDGATGARRGDFWLLGCELSGRVGATQTSDLPLRFLFRLPKDRVKVGATWEARETAFGDLPVHHPGISPLEVTGLWRLRQVRKAELEDLFKVAARGRKDLPGEIDLALVEGRFEFFRCNWTNAKAVKAESKPSATLATLAAVRLSDGAILGGKWRWTGRTENYSTLSGPGVGKGDDSGEALLREPLIELSRTALKERIDRAVDAGVRWLRSQQQPDGRICDANGYPVGTAGGAGATAMSLLALLHSGVSVDDLSIQAGFRYLAGRRWNQSYDLSLILMAIEAKYLTLGREEDLDTFDEEKARESIAGKITKEDRETAEQAARILQECQDKGGLFGYADTGYPNLSSTQYAILGLKSASRMGVKIPVAVWRKTLDYLREAAQVGEKTVMVRTRPRGGEPVEREAKVTGWGYIHPAYPSPTGTMTCAALSTLAICRSELARASEWNKSVAKSYEDLEWGGLAWIQEHYGIRAATPEGCTYFASLTSYYLYGLERSLILRGLEEINGHEWYLEGAGILITWQNVDGRWESPQHCKVIDTAFALLFLKRATIPVATPSAGSK